MSDERRDASQDSAFLDDFYAECDEHLTAVRHALAALEALPSATELPKPTMEGLFRHLHSLKGILGMAGLPGYERLAHATEDYLRSLSRGEVQLGPEGLDTISAVTTALERALAAHRKQESLPDPALFLARVAGLPRQAVSPAALTPSTSRGGATSDPIPQEKAHRARAAGKTIYAAEFAPTPELNQAGINVDTVRARLQGLGEILQSLPRIEPAGGIVFEFIIAADQAPPSLEQWNTEGLTLRASPSAEPRGGSGPATTPNPASPGSTDPAYLTPSQIVRVDLSRLDELMRGMGEIVVQRARLEELLERVADALPAAEAGELQEISDVLDRQVRRLREGVMRVRLVPVAEIFERMALVVRDLARETRRKIRLATRGQDTQIDKYIVERLKDPFLHLVRNAATHGLEPPERRAARGKPEALTISLSAATVGESVILEVSDDGAGLDKQKIREQARRSGIDVPGVLGSNQWLDLLCLPGFSTRDQADLGAGRGVGMSVVKRAITELRGDLRLRSEPGQGTTFILRVPLTLAIGDALLIGVAGQRFAVLQAGLQEVTTVKRSEVVRLEEAEFMRYRDGILPLVRLARLFELVEEERPEHRVLVIGHGSERVGVVADRVLGKREIMVRALSDPLFKIPAVSGATELGDGRPVLILDALNLMRAARHDGEEAAGQMMEETSYAGTQ